MKPFISACLIVKNEEDMLRRCLESLQGGVDEIVIVDTGSTDKTKEIAQEFTDEVYDFEWTNDFAEARNFAASKASGEWIIAIDADECVDAESFAAAIQEIQSHKEKFNIYLVEIMSFTGDAGEEITVNNMARLYKNDENVYFTGAIHEQLQTKKGEVIAAISSVKLYHYGYLTQVVEKQDKKNRNLNIIKQNLKKEKNNGFSYFNYGQELRRLGKTKEALNNFVKAYSYKKSVDEGWVRTCLFFIVECLVELKRYEEALNIVRDTEELWPSAPDFTFWRGDIYFLQKRYDDAKEVYQSILANNMTYREVIYHFDRKTFLPHERLGRIYQIEKNNEEALKHYIEALNENSASIRIITKIVQILSEYHTEKEVYEFLIRQNIIKTDSIRLNLVKYLINAGYADLAEQIANDLENGNKKLIKVINLKAKMITISSVEDGTLILEKNDLLLGIQVGLFDLGDLCILYNITKNECVKDFMKHSNFTHVFECLFGESRRTKKIKQEEYLSILRKALCYNQVDFVEKLITLKKLVHKDIDAKIADLFYEYGYEDIALDFYRLVNRNHITKQGYVNIIEWLITNINADEAYHIALEAISKYGKDFRFYKYALELMEEDVDGIMLKALQVFTDSNWLNRQLILSF